MIRNFSLLIIVGSIFLPLILLASTSPLGELKAIIKKDKTTPTSLDLPNYDMRKIQLLNGNDFEGGLVFYNANLKKSNFSGMKIINVNFDRTNLEEVDFSNTTLKNVKFNMCNMKCQFYWCKIILN